MGKVREGLETSGSPCGQDRRGDEVNCQESRVGMQLPGKRRAVVEGLAVGVFSQVGREPSAILAASSSKSSSGRS